MKTWSYAAAFGLATWGFGASHADTGIMPKPPGGFDPFKSKVEVAPRLSAAAKPHLIIAAQIARREGHDIRFYATVQTSGGVATAAGAVSTTPTLTGTWTLYREEGKRWKSIQSGNILVRDRERFPLKISYSTDAAARLKLELRTHSSNAVVAGKPIAVPQLLYVVKYRLLEWKVKSGKTADESAAAQNSINYANAYFNLGFETLPEYRHHQRLLASDYFTWQVSYRCVNWLERTFPTNAAAAEFMNSLPPFTNKRLSLR